MGLVLYKRNNSRYRRGAHRWVLKRPDMGAKGTKTKGEANRCKLHSSPPCI